MAEHFSTGLCHRHVKTTTCLGKGEKHCRTSRSINLGSPMCLCDQYVSLTASWLENNKQHTIKLNPLLYDKNSVWSKLKAFADDKINVIWRLKFAWGREENNVGKGENAGYQHFLLFPQCFQKATFSGGR